MSEREAVLFANDAFYLCFAGEDVDSMDGLWASNAPVTCIHPGWEALYGREEVLESWRSIIAGSAPISVAVNRVSIYGDFATFVTKRWTAYLIATNTFVREAGNGKWSITKLVLPAASQPKETRRVLFPLLTDGI